MRSPRRCSRSSTSTGVVLGHSERRQFFGETDRALALKVPAALNAGLNPILCVGETEAERDDDEPSASCASRSGTGLAGVPTSAWPR